DHAPGMLRLEVHHVAACHAASDGHSRFQRPEALAGRVVYLAGEDPAPALIRRVYAIGQHLNQSAREAIAENL
ncbi:helicase RepA family protein, partial [Aeromonas caviae]|uniref:helicase RepA family protein n=2 Tax=Aeromonas caviae TaxID=648 RepID=UPI001CC3472F